MIYYVSISVCSIQQLLFIYLFFILTLIHHYPLFTIYIIIVITVILLLFHYLFLHSIYIGCIAR